MSPSLQTLKAASSDLPLSERAELAHFLLQSLEAKDPDWAEAWRDELKRRVADIQQGAVNGVPAEEVLGRLRERYP